jgi:L-serine dehydratase
MNLSVFDLFSIGIGPSSSHTVGPMKAAKIFALSLIKSGEINKTSKIQIELYGSLGFTGKAHGSEKAIAMGLEGENPEEINPDNIADRLTKINNTKMINILGENLIPFSLESDLIFNRKENLPLHSNGMKFRAFNKEGNLIIEKTYYSIGGGFLKTEDDQNNTLTKIPYNFSSGKELLDLCTKNSLTICNLMLENEMQNRDKDEIYSKILQLWKVMDESIENGFKTDGILPGGLKVKRRAKELNKTLTANINPNPLDILDWVSLFALSVNEENAAGGRVVTAPTNGAAGIIPAVIKYYLKFENGSDEGIIKFFLTATAIGALFKTNASISGAEVGCQGEVGVACSMAAAGLTEVMGGTPAQVENAAEIGMEHNLGLTCDPIGGLVQVPCIERNAMGAIKAINASRLALRGDGSHFVSLDKVIKTMKATGADMKDQYKETSRGGLAVNVIEC